MNEDFLSYLWKYGLFDASSLTTTTGQPVTIIHPGQENKNAGPDFFNARIKVDGTEWAGNVEIHVKSSEWLQHGHQFDATYGNVILHVVHENDQEICFPSTSTPIPSIQLKDKFDHVLFDKYKNLVQSDEWIPCGKKLPSIDDTLVVSWKARLLIERLERKTAEIEEQLKVYKYDWEQVFFILFMKHFGMSVNNLPFEMLAKSLPVNLLYKHRNLFQIEALLFGQAGLLEGDDCRDDYYLQLKKEYEFLRAKLKLQPIDGNLWKFMRMRPVNFPTVRIAQVAALIKQLPNLFSSFLNIEDTGLFFHYLRVSPSSYWNDHYTFGNASPSKVKILGNNLIENILINSFAPFLYVYGINQGKEELWQQAVEMLSTLPSEENSIVKNWKKCGITSKSAADSQALIELKNSYCDKRKCLKCHFGFSLLKK